MRNFYSKFWSKSYGNFCIIIFFQENIHIFFIHLTYSAAVYIEFAIHCFQKGFIMRIEHITHQMASPLTFWFFVKNINIFLANINTLHSPLGTGLDQHYVHVFLILCVTIISTRCSFNQLYFCIHFETWSFQIPNLHYC